MLYKKDFKHMHPQFNSRGFQKTKPLVKVDHLPTISILSNKVNVNEGYQQQGNRNLPYWHKYCENTSVHGIKYFVERDLHWSER